MSKPIISRGKPLEVRTHKIIIESVAQQLSQGTPTPLLLFKNSLMKRLHGQQQHGFNDLPPRVGSGRFRKSAKSFISALK